MEKPSILRNLLVKALVFCVFLICFRFAYVITLRGESCDVSDFCFFSAATTAISTVESTAGTRPSPAVMYYSSIFQDLISEGFLSPQSKSLVVETQRGEAVAALKAVGVLDSFGVAKKTAKPFVIGYKNSSVIQFKDDTFDFIFAAAAAPQLATEVEAEAGNAKIEKVAAEICRTMKPEGYLVVHTRSNDTYSLHSFIQLFNCCSFIKSSVVQSDSEDSIREIIMKKEYNYNNYESGVNKDHRRQCDTVPGYKEESVRNAEALIAEEPSKPWITLKRNIQNIKYLPSMVDISFKSRYIYVDVGARSYGSSIGSWFRKQYPKQNRTFEVYAIEADKSFYKEYEAKKKWVKLLPYAAWVRNESLFFEVNHDPGDDAQEKGSSGRGMGRIKPVQEGGKSGVERIPGFDFAYWLKNTVTERDFVVMKMDVEGTEFELIPRLIETGAICLIDEIFLECHYNRWQRCCPGVRSAKYEKTYGQCLDLFTSLRARGVLVHQWW